jgi:hypothetical protein
MRYYAIKIDGAPAVFPGIAHADTIGAQWCSVIGGKNDPSAQQVEFDLSWTELSNDTPNCVATVYNIPFDQIGAMANLIDHQVSIFGGMYPGLPLATQHYQRNLTGFLCGGQIVRCWGAWNGTEMSISFAFAPSQIGQTPGQEASQPSESNPVVGTTFDTGGMIGGSPKMARRAAPRRFARVGVMPLDSGGISLGGVTFGSGFSIIGGVESLLFGGGGTLSNPLNLVHNLMPNMPLSTAIQQTLNTAFPGLKLSMSISPNLKLPSQDAGIFQSMTQYAAQIKQLSQSILGTANNYSGVKMVTNGQILKVFDTASPPINGERQIQFADLVGQPTWSGINEINITCVMRCDVQIGDVVTLPPGLLTGVGMNAGYSGALAGAISFQGSFDVTQVRHVGNFRDPNGNAWVTVITATVRGGGAPVGTGGAGKPGELGTPVTPQPTFTGRFPGPVVAAGTRRVKRYV